MRIIMEPGTLLFYGGVAAMAVATVAAAAAVILFHAVGKRLRRRLEEEYGEKW